MGTHICRPHRFRPLCKHTVEREREKGGERKMKKGGRASRDKDSSAVLPSTHIHSDPLSSVCLSLTDTLTHTRCSHHMAVNAQMISSIHTQSSYSHRCTHPSTSSSKHNTNNTFTQHTASALTHLGRGKVASCFLSVS